MGCSSSIIKPSIDKYGINLFKYENIIGKGGYSIVRSATYLLNGEMMAIKQQILNKLTIKNAIKEVNILKRINHYNHPYIVHLCSAFNDLKFCYIVINYYHGGDLRRLIKNEGQLPETSVVYLISCIGSALLFLHEHNILHRDIKPDNILLDSKGIPYLADFGISMIDETHIIPICQNSSGTTHYVAPELLVSKHYHSYQADYWSLGIVAYELLFGIKPFEKNCPRRYIYYSQHKYTKLWDYLLTLNKKSNTVEKGIDINLQNILMLNQCTIPPPNNSDKVEIYLSKRDIELINSITISENNEEIFPEDFFLTIPSITRHGTLTDSCIDFLSMILDVRITHRLGYNPTNKSVHFTNHSWFSYHKILFNQSYNDRIITSIQPHRPDIDVIFLQILTQYPENISNILDVSFVRDEKSFPQNKRHDETNDQDNLTESDYELLKNFQYISPSDPIAVTCTAETQEDHSHTNTRTNISTNTQNNIYLQYSHSLSLSSQSDHKDSYTKKASFSSYLTNKRRVCDVFHHLNDNNDSNNNTNNTNNDGDNNIHDENNQD